MGIPAALGQLEDRRTVECRLTPNRALATLEEAAAFVMDRGLLTRTPDCALPSLFGACHEEPGRAEGRGFDLWPRTKWIWSFQLALQPDVLLTKLHRGKSLYLSIDTAALFDPLVRSALDTATGDDADLLDHLGRHGPSSTEDIEHELGWDRKRLKRSRQGLERVGAVVSDGLVFESATSWYYAPMRRWDQVVAAAGPRGNAHSEVVMAGVRAAVVAQESNVRTWFSWPIPVGTVDSLLRAGRLIRPAPGWVSEPLRPGVGRPASAQDSPRS